MYPQELKLLLERGVEKGTHGTVLVAILAVVILRYIVGVDEVGRGPLAGPVTVGAVALPISHVTRFRGVRDSKQLTAKDREAWEFRIRGKEGEGIKIAISSSSPSIIDRYGIVFAIKKALRESLRKLEVHPDECIVLLDGGLYAPKIYTEQQTIIKGDEKEPAIALASIVAKVHRDRVMVKWAGRFPEYGFELHKGYGTSLHYAALKKHGTTHIHRKSFLGSL